MSVCGLMDRAGAQRSRRRLPWLLVLALLTTACSPATSTPEPSDGSDAEQSDAQTTLDTQVEDTNPRVDVFEPTDIVADVSGDAGSDAGSDTGDSVDTVDVPIVDPVVSFPLGETLFLDGDDYLYFWGEAEPASITLTAKPAGATAEIADGRLTPDRTGEWVLTRGEATATVVVADDLLDEDTFLNFNYTPNQPMALDDNGTLWVTCPTSNAIQSVTLDETGGVPGALVPTGSWPTSIVNWPGSGLLLVAQTGRDSLGFVDVASGRLVDAIQVGNEPAGIVVLPDHADGPTASVALAGANAVARVDLTTRTVVGTLPVGREPRAVAFDAATGRLYVASLLSGNATPRGPLTVSPVPDDQQPDIAVIDTSDFSLVGHVHAVGTLVRGLFMAPGTSELVAAVGHSENAKLSVSAGSRPHRHGLAIIDVSVTQTDTPGDANIGAVTQIDLDVRPGSAGPAPSPHTLGQSPDGMHLVATLSAGNALLLMDAQSRDETGRLAAGSDPRGLVFAAGRLWTFAWLDNALQSWPQSVLDDPIGAESVRTEVTLGADPRPAVIARGQRLFNDASFSGNQDFSCNNCHIDGLTDGLVWNILLDGNVNTLAFRNIGGTGPFLWGGFLPTLFDFSREVLRLVGAEATGPDMADLTTYMQSVTAPPNPFTAPGGRFTAEAQQGRGLFEATVAEGGAGCAVCHSGPLLTNREQVAGKTPGKSTDVPSLIGVYDTGPWGREAQWDTLDAMVEFAAEFTGAELDADQLAALNAYVRQLPGDLLYLNGALPLDGTKHTFPGTPIELTFSWILEGGQEHLFSLVKTSEDEAPLAGTFDVRGRKVRFHPEGDTLPLETSFELRVAQGLRGAFGQTTQGPIVLQFETGGVPTVDVTGKWMWDVSGLVSGTIVISFIQSAGGQVSGVVLDGGGLIDLDHLEGFVSDDLLQIEPFLVDSPVGEVQVSGAEATMLDPDDDGFADSGTGKIISPFGSLNVTMQRLAD